MFPSSYDRNLIYDEGNINMKKWKTLTIIGIISVALAGCISQQDAATDVKQSDDNQHATHATDTTKTEANEQSNGQTNEQKSSGNAQEIRTYVNQTDAWMVELPQTWNDVHIIESARNTEFIFPSKNPEHKQALFWISAVSEQEWEKAQKEGPVGTAKEITRKDGDVYLYHTPLDMVLEGDEIKKFEELFKDVPVIIESFKFE